MASGLDCASSRRRTGNSAGRGQATVEYVLLVSLIVVAIFGAIFLFRHTIYALATAAWLKLLELTGN